MERPKLIMLVGIPGSGKTKYANKLLDEMENVKLFSSDAIRKELFGTEECQDNNEEVFKLMIERTVAALKEGYHVIYDATNLTRKNRKSLLTAIPKYVNKTCTVVWAPIETCVERDEKRERTVCKEVIDKMLKRFQMPFYDEGFDNIYIEDTTKVTGYDINFIEAKLTYTDKLLEDLKIPHDNPNHSLNIYEHCEKCYELLKDQDIPDEVKLAGQFHDIGKPYTKSFTNSKGNPCETAHYYGHQSVGAWLVCGIFEDVNIAWLVSSHMVPFTDKKYYNSLDPLYKNILDILHQADLDAH